MMAIWKMKKTPFPQTHQPTDLGKVTSTLIHLLQRKRQNLYVHRHLEHR
jgi:hypothetical protein